MENPFTPLNEKIDLVIKRLDEFEKKLCPTPETKTDETGLVTPKEACKILGIAPSTLWKYKKQGRVKCYAISGKRFYKRSELIDSLTPVSSSGD